MPTSTIVFLSGLSLRLRVLRMALACTLAACSSKNESEEEASNSEKSTSTAAESSSSSAAAGHRAEFDAWSGPIESSLAGAPGDSARRVLLEQRIAVEHRLIASAQNSLESIQKQREDAQGGQQTDSSIAALTESLQQLQTHLEQRQHALDYLKRRMAELSS